MFAYAMSWVGVWLGMLVPTVEVAQQVVFTAIFPLTFVSNAFVPLESLPGWMQPFAEWQPVSAVTSSMRDLFGNPNPAAMGEAFPAQHPVLADRDVGGPHRRDLRAARHSALQGDVALSRTVGP